MDIGDGLSLIVAVVAVVVALRSLRLSRRSLALSLQQDRRSVELFVDYADVSVAGQPDQVRALRIRAVNVGHRPVTLMGIFLLRQLPSSERLIFMVAEYLPEAGRSLPVVLGDGESITVFLLESEFLAMLGKPENEIVTVVPCCDDAQKIRHYGFFSQFQINNKRIESFSPSYDRWFKEAESSRVG